MSDNSALLQRVRYETRQELNECVVRHARDWMSALGPRPGTVRVHRESWMDALWVMYVTKRVRYESHQDRVWVKAQGLHVDAVCHAKEWTWTLWITPGMNVRVVDHARGWTCTLWITPGMNGRVVLTSGDERARCGSRQGLGWRLAVSQFCRHFRAQEFDCLLTAPGQETRE